MAFVPASHLSLMRGRRKLNNSMLSGDWEKVIEAESDLFAEIDNAVKDSNRSPRELLSELTEIIRLYKSLSDTCIHYSETCRDQEKF